MLTLCHSYNLSVVCTTIALLSFSMEIYYKLSLKTCQKPVRRIKMKCGNCDLTDLNLLLNSMVSMSRRAKAEKPHAPILKLLDKIIPNEYFGTTHHRKLFYKVVKKIATQSDFECIFRRDLNQGYDYNSIPWMSNIQSELHRRCLLKRCNIYVLEKVVKPLISFFYKPIRTMNGHEIEFVERQKWNSFESKVYNSLIYKQHLVKVEDDTIRPRGHLCIIPKNKYDVNSSQPLIRVCPNKNKWKYRLINSKVYEAARKNKMCSLYDCWKGLIVGTNKELFGVKLDIKDVYGNVNIQDLCQLVLNLSQEHLSDELKIFVVNHITNQFVKFRKCVYKWNHGLLQGDRLSSCLCELYMSDLDLKHLQNVENSFVHRTVDQYFFCSSDARKVEEFIKKVTSVHQVNDEKTQTNIHGNNQLIQYCGKSFNMSSRQVTTHYDFDDKFAIRQKFRLWNEKKPVMFCDFVKRALSFSSCNNSFTKLELNTVFNTSATVLKNYFNGMVYTAYKFDAAVVAIRDSTSDLDFTWTVLTDVVAEFAYNVYRKVLSYTGNECEVAIPLKTLKMLGYKAFVLVLKRRNEVHKHMIKKIEDIFHVNVFCKKFGGDFQKLPACFQNLKINRKVCI